MVQQYVLLRMLFSSVAPFTSTLQFATLHEMYKDISPRRAVSSFSERLILGIIRPAAHSWRGKDPADLRTRQTTSLHLEIPANHP